MNPTNISPADHNILAWLCSIKNFNGNLGHRFVDSLESIQEIMNLSEEQLALMLPPAALKALLTARKNISVSSVLDSISQNNAYFCSYYDINYPQHLKTIPDAPLGIFVRGKLPSDAILSVAIIGARNCSEYGMYIANELGSYLGENGIQVISGMAYGIDGISQTAALKSGGTSYGILGSGVDVCYPPSNKALYEHLISSGGIISTYGMGERAIASNFPPRNRIVSGLSDAVVVIEARQKSGTIITVDMALEQGREVYAVPGRITDRLSDGCNGLIGQGASIYLSPEIFLSELTELFDSKPGTSENSSSAISLHRNFCGKPNIPPDLNSEQSLVYQALNITPLNIEDICNKLYDSGHPEYTYPQVSMILIQLMLDNHAKQVSQGCFCKVL